MSNKFALPLVEFWSRLQGEVHPDDARAAAAAPPEINFDYPPPAFIGDVLGARVFVLMGNGGYSLEVTPTEFAHTCAANLFRARLVHPGPADESITAPYYLSLGTLSGWLRNGRAAVVNAMSYRSEAITKPVVRFADILPSVRFHRRWLNEHLVPAAEAGQVRVVIHRPRLWKVGSTISRSSNLLILDGAAPARKYLSQDVLAWAAMPPRT